MGKKACCTPEIRQVMFEHYQRGKTITEIADMLCCSRKKVYNAFQLIQENPIFLKINKQRKLRPRKTSQHVDRLIVRHSKAHPFHTAEDCAAAINETNDLQLSTRTVKRRLNKAGLFGRVAPKPLLSTKNIKVRKEFAKMHINNPVEFWKKTVWSDETKVNRIGPDGQTFVRRPVNQQFKSSYTQKTVKFGGGSLMVWGAFSWYGVGPIHRIEGIMDKYQYKSILENVLVPYTDDEMPISWIFMHDNDPKHKSKFVSEYLTKEKIKVLDWRPQSPDLNPIENLWNDVKLKIRKRKFKNNDDLWEGIREAWYSIPAGRCRSLVESMRRRLDAVLKNKGQNTKH